MHELFDNAPSDTPSTPIPTPGTPDVLHNEVTRLLHLIEREQAEMADPQYTQPSVPTGPIAATASRASYYRLIFSSGLYAWYRLPACEVPLRLPLWPGKVEHYDQQKRIVLLRPAIAGYEHETEEVHLTQVVAWFQVNLDEGTVKEVLLHAPRTERADQADRRSNAQAVKESSQ